MTFCKEMKTRILLPLVLTLAIGSCIGSSKRSGSAAKAEFHSRTGITLPATTTDWEFASFQRGDVYGEYFRFRCTKELFLDTTKKLRLASDTLSSGSGDHWARGVGESAPSDPAWWRLASLSDLVYYKEDYSTVANRSIMACWHEEDTGYVYMSIDFWD